MLSLLMPFASGFREIYDAIVYELGVTPNPDQPVHLPPTSGVALYLNHRLLY
jgi:hypothetical protein